MTDLFVYGTLCHAPLLRIVTGREVATQPASMADHAVYWAEGQDFPVLIPQPGATAHGFVLAGLTAEDMARLDYYEGPFGYGTRPVAVMVGGQTRQAQVYAPEPGLWQQGAPWHLSDWAARWGDIIEATARDVMAIYPKPVVAGRRGSLLVRGSSRVRAAADPTPSDLRRKVGPGDVEVAAMREPYANFFSIEEYDLRFRGFDGGHSRTVTRAAFISGDAVTVLPYDPVRDRVLLVEQFRTGPFARGDAQPWQLEAIAGRIDPGETPETAARREAVEEAGVRLDALIPVARYYSSPGAKTEYLYSFVALTDLPDGSAILGGQADEAEDIQGHLVAFDDLMAMVASGEVATGPLILTAFWLQRERGALRRG